MYSTGPKDFKMPDVIREVEDLKKGSLRVKYKADPAAFSSATKRVRKYKAVPFQFRFGLEIMADYVRGVMIPRIFKQEGPGWAPLARMTMGMRIAQGFDGPHPILYRTGDLFEELTNKHHPKHVEVIKVGRVARIEIGGSSAKFIENQMGQPRLPARPMLPGTGQYPYIPILPQDRRQMRNNLFNALVQRVER